MEQKNLSPAWEAVIRFFSRLLAGIFGMYLLDDWTSLYLLPDGFFGSLAVCFFFGLLCEMAGLVYLEPLFLRAGRRRSPSGGNALLTTRLLLSFLTAAAYVVLVMLWELASRWIPFLYDDIQLILLFLFAILTFALALRREYGLPGEAAGAQERDGAQTQPPEKE